MTLSLLLWLASFITITDGNYTPAGAPIGDRCVVVVVGYNYGPVEVSPPCQLDWWLEHDHTAPYADDITPNHFAADCHHYGGIVTDTTGDVWVCENIDY